MCRLFGLHAGTVDVTAEFWLLNAPDSFAAQSERNADGFGLAAFTSGEAQLLIRNPVRAKGNQIYQQVSRQATAALFLAHLRYLSNGEVALRNTHPFVQDNRVFAHNGILGSLDRVEARLGDTMAMVGGDTDSERLFAFVTMAIREAGGDVRAGIVTAVRELSEDFELYAINFLLAEAGHLWAFRYPETNPLLLLEREPTGDGLVEDDSAGTLHLHTQHGIGHRVVVVASEQMDQEPGWGPIEPGELVHIGPDLVVDREGVAPDPPRHRMVLPGHAARSQSFERDS